MFFPRPITQQEIECYLRKVKEVGLKYNPLEVDNSSPIGTYDPCFHSTHYGPLWEGGKCRRCGADKLEYEKMYNAAYESVRGLPWSRK